MDYWQESNTLCFSALDLTAASPLRCVEKMQFYVQATAVAGVSLKTNAFIYPMEYCSVEVLVLNAEPIPNLLEPVYAPMFWG